MADNCRAARRHGMVTRALTRARNHAWASLPAEIRLMVLEVIAYRRHPGWASSAAVCKEWQIFVEKQNFHQLKLQVSCLHDFERLIVRQRHLVRHVQLDIELPKYTCQCCKKGHLGQHNSTIISAGIWKLFRILSTWGPAKGLTLELNAHSPSDSEHWFKNFYFASDGHGDGGDDTSDCSWHDPHHGWVNGQQVTAPPPSAILRLFHTIDLRFREKLPPVDIVTCFIIRRQLRRWIWPCDLMLLLDKFVGLEHLIYEPWRQWERGWRVIHDNHFLQFVQNHLPQTLKRVSVFEDFNENLAASLVNTQLQTPLLPWPMQMDPTRIVDSRIGAAFAPKSLDLEHLAVSYLANAEDFFQACLSTWTWQRLQSLALTSQLLRHPERRQQIDALLYEAGTAALRMPRLRTLVLWDGIKGSACAFIYRTDRRHADLTWRGTWGMELSTRVVEVWERVAMESHSCPLRVGTQHVYGAIKSHGDAIHYLGLPCQVVAPASLWQIRREAM